MGKTGRTCSPNGRQRIISSRNPGPIPLSMIEVRMVTPRAAVILLLVAVAVPQESWRTKPFSEWSMAEVEQVLGESPWVQTVTIGPPPRERERKSFINRRGLTADQQENEAIAARTYQNFGSTPSIPAMPVKEPPVRRSAVDVRWLSSHTVREGVARYWQLQGRANPQALQALVTYESEQYAIGIGPISVWANSQAEGNAALLKLVARLKQSAYLQTNDGKKVSAMAVEVPRGPSLTPAAAVILYFPMHIEGKPLLTETTRKVRFHCELDHYSVTTSSEIVKINVEFDLRKMIRNGKADL